MGYIHSVSFKKLGYFSFCLIAYIRRNVCGKPRRCDENIKHSKPKEDPVIHSSFKKTEVQSDFALLLLVTKVVLDADREGTSQVNGTSVMTKSQIW